jgi:multiple sugar transport system substrate-binding protein
LTFGPDESGGLRTLIDRFNRENKGEIRVHWREAPALSDEYFDQIRTELQSGSANMDVIAGDVVFMRNWPFVYGLLSDPELSKVKPEQVGLALIPVADEGVQSVSGLGGWNFLVNANSEDKLDEIWTFIEFMSSTESQKTLALQSTRLPTLRSLYDDEEVLEKVPVADLGRASLENTRPRPVSPYYSDMSLEMAEKFNASLNGDLPVEQALAELQTELQNIVNQG